MFIGDNLKKLGDSIKLSTLEAEEEELDQHFKTVTNMYLKPTTQALQLGLKSAIQTVNNRKRNNISTALQEIQDVIVANGNDLNNPAVEKSISDLIESKFSHLGNSDEVLTAKTKALNYFNNSLVTVRINGAVDSSLNLLSGERKHFSEYQDTLKSAEGKQAISTLKKYKSASAVNAFLKEQRDIAVKNTIADPSVPLTDVFAQGLTREEKTKAKKLREDYLKENAVLKDYNNNYVSSTVPEFKPYFDKINKKIIIDKLTPVASLDSVVEEINSSGLSNDEKRVLISQANQYVTATQDKVKSDPVGFMISAGYGTGGGFNNLFPADKPMSRIKLMADSSFTNLLTNGELNRGAGGDVTIADFTRNLYDRLAYSKNDFLTEGKRVGILMKLAQDTQKFDPLVYAKTYGIIDNEQIGTIMKYLSDKGLSIDKVVSDSMPKSNLVDSFVGTKQVINNFSDIYNGDPVFRQLYKTGVLKLLTRGSTNPSELYYKDVLNAVGITLNSDSKSSSASWIIGNSSDLERISSKIFTKLHGEIWNKRISGVGFFNRWVNPFYISHNFRVRHLTPSSYVVLNKNGIPLRSSVTGNIYVYNDADLRD